MKCLNMPQRINCPIFPYEYVKLSPKNCGQAIATSLTMYSQPCYDYYIINVGAVGTSTNEA